MIRNERPYQIPYFDGLKRTFKEFLAHNASKDVPKTPSAKLVILTTIGNILPHTNYSFDPAIVYIAAQKDAALQFITKIFEELPKAHVTLVDFPPNCILLHQDKIRRLNALAYWQKSALVLASSHKPEGNELYRNLVSGLTNTSFQYWDDRKIYR